MRSAAGSAAARAQGPHGRRCRCTRAGYRAVKRADRSMRSRRWSAMAAHATNGRPSTNTIWVAIPARAIEAGSSLRQLAFRARPRGRLACGRADLRCGPEHLRRFLQQPFAEGDEAGVLARALRIDEVMAVTRLQHLREQRD